MRLFLSDHETGALRAFRGIFVFACLMIINRYFGYLDILDNVLLLLLVSALCAFMPLSGSSVVVGVAMVLNLTGLSVSIALVFLILLVVSYLLCGFYRSKKNYYVTAIPVMRQLYIPYFAPLEAGMLGTVNDLSAVICGGVVSFYLNDVRTNAASIMDEASEVNAATLLLDMVQNKMFYIYMVALITLFLTVYGVKFLRIEYAWILSVVFGVLAEFLIMLGGYIFLGLQNRIPQLVWGNIITLVFGLILTFFFRDLDYNRVERVQFEDDEYYYYVTAVPKNRIEAEQKKIQKITGD